MNKESTINFVNTYWDENIIPNLSKFINIPCKSMPFDPAWQENKYLDQAAHLIADWAKAQNIEGLVADVVTLENCAPSLFIDIPGQIDKTVLFYGHIDKMPESEGWDAGLEPWKAVLRGENLFGRGSVDDGYPPYLAIAAIKALREQKIAHPRCVIFLESGEECGSPYFDQYLDHFKNRIGAPGLIVFPDSDADKERLLSTNSLRGLVDGVLSVEVLKSGVHSGTASGIVPSTFRILRQLLDRIEDQNTGAILIESANVVIPQFYRDKAKEVAAVYGNSIYENLSMLEGCQPVNGDLVELILNSTWRPTLCVIGAEGLPTLQDAGNVLRACTKVRLSLRLPPGVNAASVIEEVKQKLESNPPYGAHVKAEFSPSSHSGWCAKEDDAIKFDNLLSEIAKIYYPKGFLSSGVGGGIGPVTSLAKVYPEAQIWITGLLLPESGAHGPNECLHIPTAKKLTCCLAHLLQEYFNE